MLTKAYSEDFGIDKREAFPWIQTYSYSFSFSILVMRQSVLVVCSKQMSEDSNLLEPTFFEDDNATILHKHCLVIGTKI